MLAYASDSLQDKIEKVDMHRGNFIGLLKTFVDSQWRNNETYNTFIRGFGNDFEKFNDEQAVKFVSLLVQANLNQADIIDAVV